jgi:hypothetical protein
MIFELFQRMRRASPLQIFGRCTQHAPITHKLAPQMLTRQVISYTYFQIEPFADYINNTIKHVQANVELGISL